MVIAAAQAIASQHAPEALKAARILDVTAAGQEAATPQNRADWSAKLLAEAAQTPGVILWVPAIEVGTVRGPGDLWMEFLQKAARSVRCISRVSTEVCEQSIKTDRRWRR